MTTFHSKTNKFYGLREWISFGLITLIVMIILFFNDTDIFFIVVLGLWFVGLASFKIRKILLSKIVSITVDKNEIRIRTNSKEYNLEYPNLNIVEFSDKLTIKTGDNYLKIHSSEWDSYSEISSQLKSKTPFSNPIEKKTNPIMDILNILLPWNN